LASHLCQNGQYYIIAFDMPGHGFSDKTSHPMLYTIKSFVFSIRRVVEFFRLKNYMILAHSFGCTLTTLYTACYPEDIRQLLFVDFAFDFSVTCEDPIVCWRECIDKYVKASSSETSTPDNNNNNNKIRPELTTDLAVEILLKANKNLDSDAAKTLLERGLMKKSDGKLAFSRDAGLGEFLPIRFHFSEFKSLREHIVPKIKCPILAVYACPCPYGDKSHETVVSILDDIERASHVSVTETRFDGVTHHFHMIEAKATSDIILNYLLDNNKL